MSDQTNADLANELRSELGKAAAGFPANYWMAAPNISGAGTTTIVVPVAGNLWVYYSPGSAQAKEICVWHQGGTRTPIQQGENTIRVGQSDMIYYRLGNPTTDTIKVAFQYV